MGMVRDGARTIETGMEKKDMQHAALKQNRKRYSLGSVSYRGYLRANLSIDEVVKVLTVWLGFLKVATNYRAFF